MAREPTGSTGAAPLLFHSRWFPCHPVPLIYPPEDFLPGLLITDMVKVAVKVVHGLLITDMVKVEVNVELLVLPPPPCFTPGGSLAMLSLLFTLQETFCPAFTWTFNHRYGVFRQDT